ncbi:MAG: DNA replication/repair protein RecF [Chlamydiae bacterium]|nr:DNA replication/repair protein RecF [Chlamydiota bacterium]MBI3266877.1 DNA replication/repair protein RecF [Chlamydiota bacterium]
MKHILSEISVKDYRNIKWVELGFSCSQNIFAGDNAQGKTNLLEAIYLLATGRSFRTSNLEDLFPWDGGRPRVRGLFQAKGRPLEVELELSSDRKMARVNGVEKARLSQLLGQVQIVEIIPQDILLVDGEPSRRRRFLDLGISEWDTRYYLHSIKYHQGLRQRNKALQGPPDLARQKVRVWNSILEENGSYLSWKRKKMVEALNEGLSRVYPQVSSKDELAEVRYLPTVEGETLEEIRTALCEKFLREEPRDLVLGHTTVGPHRDDLSFLIRGEDASTFASEGQKRSLVIALKLSLGVFLKEVQMRDPIFILDDVLTQLDQGRRKGLLNVLTPYQSFVAVTSRELDQEWMRGGRWFHVQGGSFEGIEI